MKKILMALGAISLLIWACHLNSDDGEIRVDVEGDSAWTGFEKLVITVNDTDGNPVETLFEDSLTSLDRLKGLPAGKYPGGVADITIQGYVGDSLVFEQVRRFDERTGKAEVRTLKDERAELTGLRLDPASLILYTGDKAAAVLAVPTPGYAHPGLEWISDKDGIADVEPGSGGYDATITPKAAGAFVLTVRSAGDTAISAEIDIEVRDRKPVVALSLDDSVISIGDTVTLKASARESFGELAYYIWDYDGDGVAEDSASLSDSTLDMQTRRTFPDSGSVKAVFRVGDAYGKVVEDSVRIRVVTDPPLVYAGRDTTAKTGAAIAFQGSATQDFGRFVSYKWDFDGDGTWDDSSTGQPDMTHAFSKEDIYHARLQVRDDDGITGTDERVITISDAPIVLLSKSADTSVNIKDEVAFTASIRNEDGKDLDFGWDFDGDGTYDDSSASNSALIEMAAKHAYAKAEEYKASLRVRDADGNVLISDTVRVRVLLDAPSADLGADFSVLVGTAYKVTLLGRDSLGTIAKREISLDGGDFIPLASQETTLVAPATKGEVRIVGRVTDDDGQSGVDTLMVTAVYATGAKLAGIVLAGGTLAPAFSPDTLNYEVAVAYSVGSLSMGAVAQDTKAAVTVNGTPLTSSVTSVAIALKAGPNAIPIVVTAQDTSVKVTYTVTITRAPSNNSYLSALVPSAGGLSPAFSASSPAYTLVLPDTADSLKLTPTAQDAASGITVDGKTVVSGKPSQAVPVPLGTRTLATVVTAADGSKRTYTLTLKRSTWIQVGKRGFTPAKYGLESLIADKGKGYAAFIDSAKAPYRAAVWRFDSTNWISTTSGGLLKDSNVTTVDMAYDPGGIPYLVIGTSPAAAWVRKWQGSTWQAVAKQHVSYYGISNISIDFDGKGLPYFAYHHSYMQQQPLLYKFADTVWTFTSLSTGGVDSSYNVRMAISKVNSQPYIAFTRGAYNTTTHKAHIETLKGTTVSSVGTVNWPVANAPIAFEIDPAGIPYYAYIDPSTKKIVVKKYTSDWTVLGPAGGFSDGEASSVSLAFVGSTPFAAYRDSKSATVVVRQWTGSAWKDWGATGFSAGDVGAVKIAVDGTDVWVAYSEPGNAGKISAMRRSPP